jgi:para-nitrobenzyl esterase
MYLWARERGETVETPSFLYPWDHVLAGPDADRFGAFHTSEVPYVMNTLHMSDRPFVDVDHETAERMSSYWARFAETGDPNGPGLMLHYRPVERAGAAQLLLDTLSVSGD